MITENYYEILGISMFATTKEIKQAYRKYVKKNHPDVNTNDTTKIFLLGQKAYETLINPISREKYNKTIEKDKYNTSTRTIHNIRNAYNNIPNNSKIKWILRRYLIISYDYPPEYIEELLNNAKNTYELDNIFKGLEIIRTNKLIELMSTNELYNYAYYMNNISNQALRR